MLLACNEMAKSLAEKKVVSALHALCHHTWPPAVSGTAAAIALESALAVCANAFINEVLCIRHLGFLGKSQQHTEHAHLAQCSALPWLSAAVTTENVRVMLFHRLHDGLTGY